MIRIGDAQSSCEQLGICQAREPRCDGCIRSRPETPEEARQTRLFWALVMVLMWGLSVATVACVAGFAWARWGHVITAAWAALLPGA